MPTDLLCDRCGYDLRAHPTGSSCPECDLPVEASRKWAGIPRRPAWRDSDPRWRRRMLAGVWILVLLPLFNVLDGANWASAIPTWTPFDFRGTVRTLSDTMLAWHGVYPPIVFCTGVVLLFSKERGRRPARMDWTRRWGVICSYVTALLAAAPILFISALVLVGIGALFLSMPARYQPRLTKTFVDVGAGYLRYGPQPKDATGIVQVAFSSVAVLLACVPLFNALRSAAPRRLAATLVAPLGLFALVPLAQIAQFYVAYPSMSRGEVTRYAIYFCPDVFGSEAAMRLGGSGPSTMTFSVELAKWLAVLAIAVWLSVATVLARRRRSTQQPS